MSSSGWGRPAVPPRTFSPLGWPFLRSRSGGTPGRRKVLLHVAREFGANAKTKTKTPLTRPPRVTGEFLASFEHIRPVEGISDSRGG